MSVSAPVPADHPLMIAWEAYKATPEYANTKKWATSPQDTDGSLWAAFERGWAAANQPPSDCGGLRAALELVVARAEAYVGIGFDTANESASLMDACDAARSMLADSVPTNRDGPGEELRPGLEWSVKFLRDNGFEKSALAIEHGAIRRLDAAVTARGGC